MNRISGTVLYSFSESHCLVQTKTHVFRIRREKLTEAEIKLLKNVGSNIVISVPRQSIDMAWRFAEPSSRTMASAVQVAPALADEVKSNGNLLQLRGKPMASFDEAHYLVQSNRYVYRIRQADLDEATRAKLASVGSHVQFRVPAKSVDFAWALDGETRTFPRAPSLQEAPDEFRRSGDSVFIRGRLLPSLHEPHYLIQTDQRIYMIQQNTISKAEQEMLSKVGSQVSVSVPAEKIEMSWPIGR